jgi:hypothetical protein
MCVGSEATAAVKDSALDCLHGTGLSDMGQSRDRDAITADLDDGKGVDQWDEYDCRLTRAILLYSGGLVFL